MLSLFFSAKNPDTACGAWSPTYIAALCVTAAAIGLFLYLSRGFTEKQVEKVIKGLAVFSVLSEIGKIIFLSVTYGAENVEIIPLYFCSLFIYSTIMASCRNRIIRKMGLVFLFYGGIIGAAAFFIHPNSCIPNYPIYHFMCIRTMLYHGSMIYLGLLIVITGCIKPKLSDFKLYAFDILIVCAIAYAANRISGKNYMYLSDPVNIGISQAVYRLNPGLYPFFVMLLQLILPFAMAYAGYRALHDLFEKRK